MIVEWADGEWSGEQRKMLAGILGVGRPFILATDTVPGLAIAGRNRTQVLACHQLVERLNALKGRDAEQPIACLFANTTVALAFCQESLRARAQALAARFWPGPLTLVVPAVAGTAPALAPEGMIGLRVPALEGAQVLASLSPYQYLLATSVNVTGEAPLTSLAAIREGGWEAKVSAVCWDRDAPEGGIASTVVRITADEIVVLREGAIPADALQALGAMR